MGKILGRESSFDLIKTNVPLSITQVDKQAKAKLVLNIRLWVLVGISAIIKISKSHFFIIICFR